MDEGDLAGAGPGLVALAGQGIGDPLGPDGRRRPPARQRDDRRADAGPLLAGQAVERRFDPGPVPAASETAAASRPAASS